MPCLARVLGVVVAGVLAAAGPAAAAPFGATLGIAVGYPSSQLFVAGAASGSSQPLLVTLPGGILSGSDSANPLFTADALHLKISGNGPGSFTGSALNGTLPLRGNLRFEGVQLPFGTTLLEVPLSIPVGSGYAGFGVGGSVTLPVAGDPDASWHVGHQSWGVGPRTVTVPYVYSFHNPVGMNASRRFWSSLPYTYMVTGTDSRTPGGAGQVTLVSPTKVVYVFDGLPGGTAARIVVGTLTLSFVPEPGTLLLLGAGAIGLGLAGRVRRRSVGPSR